MNLTQYYKNLGMLSSSFVEWKDFGLLSPTSLNVSAPVPCLKKQKQNSFLWHEYEWLPAHQLQPSYTEDFLDTEE